MSSEKRKKDSLLIFDVHHNEDCESFSPEKITKQSIVTAISVRGDEGRGETIQLTHLRKDGIWNCQPYREGLK